MLPEKSVIYNSPLLTKVESWGLLIAGPEPPISVAAAVDGSMVYKTPPLPNPYSVPAGLNDIPLVTVCVSPINVQTPEERTQLVYPVKVRITGDPEFELKPGIPADVDLSPGTGA